VSALEIQTDRLQLVLPSAALCDRYIDYLRNNREHVRSVTPARELSWYEPEAVRARIARGEEDFRAQTGLHLVILEKKAPGGPIVGDLAFSNVVRGPFQACHLGYNLDKNHVGRGYMTEALTAAIRFMFESWGMHRIMANYRPENLRSGQLLERLGFVKEGFARDYLLLDGAWRDHVLTALVRDDKGVEKG
jgi:ribosomal-protein-alanine N-acetyltransferase